VLIATASGIYSFTRSGPGASWRQAGRMLEGKHIASIAIEPTRGVIFAGTHGSGLWASEDGGDTWERRDAGIGYDNFYGLNCNLVGDEVRIYAGTEPAHLWLSTDFGNTWKNHPSLRDVPSVKDWTFPGEPHLGHVKTIAFDPRDPETFFVGVEVGGAFKTTDGGKTWKELNSPDFDTDVHRLLITPSRPGDVYMATGKGLFHSSNGGDRWENYVLPEGRIGYPDALTILPENPNVMFTAGAKLNPGQWRSTHAAYPRVARTRDAGESWEYLEGGLPLESRANIEAMTLNSYPGGYSLIAGTTDGEVFFSEDEGDHWATIGQGLPPVAKSGHIVSLNPEFAAATH
ncbi:MAG TPA: glycosyl hydrolase, partial [Chloroflexota bacterium]